MKIAQILSLSLLTLLCSCSQSPQDKQNEKFLAQISPLVSGNAHAAFEKVISNGKSTNYRYREFYRPFIGSIFKDQNEKHTELIAAQNAWEHLYLLLIHDEKFSANYAPGTYYKMEQVKGYVVVPHITNSSEYQQGGPGKEGVHSELILELVAAEIAQERPYHMEFTAP